MNLKTNRYMTLEVFFNSLKTFVDDIYKFLFGVATTVFGYFLPIKNIVHILIAFFILDMLVGWWAAKKCRGEKFSKTIVFNTTVPRLLVSIVLVMVTYSWDTTFKQELVSTSNAVGWFICGILIVSMLQNAYKATKWNVLPRLTNMIKDEIKKKTTLEDK